MLFTLGSPTALLLFGVALFVLGSRLRRDAVSSRQPSSVGGEEDERRLAHLIRSADVVLALGGAVIPTVIAISYSAMLGFGVNERCSSSGHSGGYCDRLDHLALLHAVVQAVLGAAAVDRWSRAWRAEFSTRRKIELWVVVVGYMALALAATVVYTHLAWDHANGS